MVTLMISALEGEILFARAEPDVRAPTAVPRELGALLGAAVREDYSRRSEPSVPKDRRPAPRLHFPVVGA